MWVLREVERSSDFARDVETLHKLATAPHERADGPLCSYSWSQLEQLTPSKDRGGRAARSWDASKCQSSPSGGDYPLEHVRKYMGKVRKVAARYLLSKEHAAALHEHVRGGTLMLPPSDRPALRGSVASAVAADIHRVEHGAGATACRQARYDAVPRGAWLPVPGEAFSLHVRPK